MICLMFKYPQRQQPLQTHKDYQIMGRFLSEQIAAETTRFLQLFQYFMSQSILVYGFISIDHSQVFFFSSFLKDLSLKTVTTRIYEQTAVKLSMKRKALLPCLLMQNSNSPPWAHRLEALLTHSQPMFRSFLPKGPQSSVKLCQYIFLSGPANHSNPGFFSSSTFIKPMT